MQAAGQRSGMRLGEAILGADGTIYIVVRARDVRPDQPRWWVDRAWRYARGVEYRHAGPETVRDLHLEPGDSCCPLALVLP